MTGSFAVFGTPLPSEHPERLRGRALWATPKVRSALWRGRADGRGALGLGRPVLGL